MIDLVAAKALGGSIVKLLGGVRATIFLVAALSFGMSTWYYHNKSEKLELRIQVMEQAAKIAAQELKEAREKVTVKIETVYVDRIKTVYKRGAEIIKEVPVYVPSTTPDLPAGFRVLYDAATRGELPDPAAVADAAPVPAQAAATSIVENFTICRANAEKLMGLQEWVNAQLGVKISTYGAGEVGHAEKGGGSLYSTIDTYGGVLFSSGPPLQFGKKSYSHLTD